MNIINFEKVDKPRGGGVGQCEKGFFVEFRHFLMFFLGSFITYLVVFSLCLAITMRKKI